MKFFWVSLAVAGACLADSYTLDSEPLQRRQSDDCPDDFTSPIGLEYEVHCNQNQVGWDLLNPNTNAIITTNGTSIQDCMNQCATQSPLCYGTVFTKSTTTCWFKNNTFTYQPSAVNGDDDSILAVPKRGALNALDEDCQYRNSSVQTTPSGQNFTIYCNMDIAGSDYSPQNVNISGTDGWHATSLGQCMELCSEANPFCKAVAFNPGMGNGYTNCYPKSSASPGSLHTSTNQQAFIRHAAIASDPPFVQNPCTNSGQAFKSSDGTTYGLACNQNRGGNDFYSVFEPDLESCVNRCDGESEDDCVGVVFDTEFTSGWQNCYLKNDTGSPSGGADGYIWARRGGISPSKKSSKAWIAGVVVGVVVAIALAALGWWFFQRRRKRAAYSAVGANNGKAGAFDPNQSHNSAYYGSGYDTHSSYQQWPQQQWPPAAGGEQHWYAKEQPQQPPTFEMESRDVRPEMPAVQTEPSELPEQSSPVQKGSPVQTDTPVQKGSPAQKGKKLSIFT